MKKLKISESNIDEFEQDELDSSQYIDNFIRAAREHFEDPEVASEYILRTVQSLDDDQTEQLLKMLQALTKKD